MRLSFLNRYEYHMLLWIQRLPPATPCRIQTNSNVIQDYTDQILDIGRLGWTGCYPDDWNQRYFILAVYHTTVVSRGWLGSATDPTFGCCCHAHFAFSYLLLYLH